MYRSLTVIALAKTVTTLLLSSTLSGRDISTNEIISGSEPDGIVLMEQNGISPTVTVLETATINGAFVRHASSLIVQGGDFLGISVIEDGSLEIHGGQFRNGVGAGGNGRLLISGGEFPKKLGIGTFNPTVPVSPAVISGGLFKDEVTSTRELNISGGTFERPMYFGDATISGGVFAYHPLGTHPFAQAWNVSQFSNVQLQGRDFVFTELRNNGTTVHGVLNGFWPDGSTANVQMELRHYAKLWHNGEIIAGVPEPHTLISAAFFATLLAIGCRYKRNRVVTLA